ncbi:hypothetical protein [Guggenheimella bovis]
MFFFLILMIISMSLFSAVPDAVTDIAPSNSIDKAGYEVLVTLKDQDWSKLETLTSSKGIRFSPYSYVTESDIVLKPADFTKEDILTWGSYDGSGEPMKLSFSDYYKEFIYDHDYLTAPVVNVNDFTGQGNTTNNIKSFYPNATTIEYHFKGFNEEYAGIDWSSLILVFEQEKGTYKLVAIVHNAWTI